MSAESRRHLTQRRTRFRSSTSSERGTVTEVLDLAQHVYPTARTAEFTASVDDESKVFEMRPAVLVGLGLTMLFLGLHQCLCIAAGQLIAGVHDRARARGGGGGGGGMSGVVLLVAHSLVSVVTALLLQRDGGTRPPGRALSVAASLLLMTAALSCAGGAIWARAARVPVLLPLASTGLGLLCLSRAEFQRPHDVAAAADMNRYGGGFLLLSSFLVFHTAWRASARCSPCIRVTPVRHPP
ncbi:hypothetical protein V2A60_000474 [Cordyceps javanica]